MSLNTGDHFGPYDIVGKLGAGGMGVVYRARDTRLGRDVAIKTLPAQSATDPGRLKRFEQEAQAASALNHPNVLSVFDVGEQSGTPYLVTELLEGHSLRQRLEQGRLPSRKAIELVMQVAAGLAAVHEKGIVHRDLKPDNLFLTHDGRVKILDFGVARALETNTPPAAATLALTESGAVMGTAGYMSPEQVRGSPADPRSDIFALGAIFHEMLSGHLAFPGDTPVERGYAILNKEPSELGPLDVPPALERVVRRCLEKDPEQRFQNARDLAFALEAITDPSGRAAVVPAPSRRRLGRWVALAAAAVVLVATGVLVGSRRQAATAAAPATPVLAKANRVSFRNGTINAARFSSGGRGLVYAGSFEGEPRQVFAGVVDGAALRAVSSPFTGLFDVSPGDELALGTEEHGPMKKAGAVLSRVPLAGGTPRPVLEGVLSADFTPDGSGLLVTRTEGARYWLELEGRKILEADDGIANARLSPQGDLIAFQRHPVPFDDRGHVEVINLDGKPIAQSRDAWTLHGIAWAPGGKEVWFTAADRSTSRSIRALALDGTEREVFSAPGTLVLQDIDPNGRVLVTLEMMRFRVFGKVAGSDRERSLGWYDGTSPVDLSADGTTLLFAEGFGANRAEIDAWLRTFDGSSPVNISKGWPRALSPDKQWAVVSPTPPFTTLSLVPTGPGSARPLPPGDFSAIKTAHFFPHGDRLVITALDREGHGHVYVQPVGLVSGTPAGPPVKVSDEELGSTAHASPDGKTLATQQKGYAVQVDVASGKVSRLPGLEPGDAPLVWTADGQALLVGRPKPPGELRVQLLRYELGSAKLTELTDVGPDDPVGIAELKEGMITPDGKHYAYLASQHIDELYVIDGLK